MDEKRRIDPLDVRRKYDRIDKVWAEDDPWHMHVSIRYDQEVGSFLKSFNDNRYIVANIGSGDKVYNTDAFLINIDIAERFLHKHCNPICASAGAIPLRRNSLDAVVCVGSVLNYCDLIEALFEISRIMKAGGKALLEFESSESFEHFGRADFGKIATIIDTSYRNQSERIWIYKPSYVRELVSSIGMEILTTAYVHTLSSIFYRLTKNERVSSLLCRFDGIAATTFLRKYAANVVLICEKI